MSLTSEQQESLKVIAKEAAREAVQQLGAKLEERDKQLREDILSDFRQEMKSYFGEQAPSVHIVQHARLDTFLNWLDSLGKNFWGGLVSGVVKFAVAFCLGALLYSKIKG
jgi:hypothetical protein